MSFSRYEKYKDSGVEWLGEIPTHWSTAPLSALAVQIQTGPFGSQLHSEEYVDDQTPVINPSNIGDGTLHPDWSCTVGPEITERLSHHKLRVGDIVVGRRGEMGRCGLVDEISVGWLCGTGSLKIRMSPKVLPEFVSAFLRTGYSRERLKLESVGSTMDNLNAQILGRVQVPFPSVAEQLCIVRYLRAGITKIDALIEEQQRLIELLKEKRQAVISHAVTKGLNPNAPMKDSGVEWLGEVPAHWDVRAIKHIVSTPITDGPHETPNFPDEGIPFVSAEAVSAGVVDFNKIRGFISPEDHARYSQKYLPRRGDIFMVKSGATTGVTAIVETDDEFNIWSPLAVIRCSGLSNPYFVLHYMRSKNFLEAVTLNWSFGTQQNIGMGVIENLSVTVPPIEEQAEIAEFLAAQSGKLEGLLGEAQRGIALLQERRTALISAAVTGKIDVRNFQKDPA